MASLKLGSRYLHLVSGDLYAKHHLYSLRRMDASTLFYRSRSKAKAAAAVRDAAGRSADWEGLDFGTMKDARFLDKQVMHYRPLVAGQPYDSSSEVFARFGGGSKILCADGAGHSAVYDAEEHSFVPIPAMSSPKGYGHVAFSVPVPARAADGAHAHSVLSKGYVNVLFARNRKHACSVYVLDMSGGRFNNMNCFEELAYRGSREGWQWRPLPAPPFLRDPEYDVARSALPEHAVVRGAGGTRICVSTSTATYVFDTASRQWSKAGDWVLPFRSRAEHVPELGVWVGLSSDIDNPYGIWAVDLAGSAAEGGAPPTAWHLGLDLDPPPPEPELGEGDPEWMLEDQALVNLGSGRLCVVRFFNHCYERYTPALAVFTGVEVVNSAGTGEDDRQARDHGGLSLIRHKSQYTYTEGATMRVL
jgi:hypothetical protein